LVGSEASDLGAAGKRTTTSAAISSSTTETRKRLTVPSRGASDAVTTDPHTEPNVPPTPMKPNNRFACSLRNTSAMKDQNTDVMNRLKTLVQM
jgi:hypothetical protein